MKISTHCFKICPSKIVVGLFYGCFFFFCLIERELASRADQRVLRWFGHVKRMDEYRMASRVLTAEVSKGEYEGDRGYPGWMVCTWPWATEEWRRRLLVNTRKIGKSGEPRYTCNWMSDIFAWLCILSGRPPVLWWLSPGGGWDAVLWCSWDKL